MRTNTLVSYVMSAGYREWEPQVRTTDGRTYRNYGAARRVKCNVVVSTIGAVSLLAPERLQTFAIIQDMTDAGGVPVMDEVWYSIQKVTPVYDAFGHISSYKHNLAVLAAELIQRPIDAPVEYPDLDQQS